MVPPTDGIIANAVKYLYHLTITTGHARKSLRTEISDDALAVCSDLIAALRTAPGTRIEMPGPPGYEISARIEGRCMSAQIYAVGEPNPVVRLGIAASERCGSAIWRWLDSAVDQPRAPWLAVTVEPAMMAHMDCSLWLGDFERCLGWAFLDLLEANDDAR